MHTYNYAHIHPYYIKYTCMQTYMECMHMNRDIARFRIKCTSF